MLEREWTGEGKGRVGKRGTGEVKGRVRKGSDRRKEPQNHARLRDICIVISSLLYAMGLQVFYRFSIAECPRENGPFHLAF